MQDLLDLLKLIALCATITVLGIVTYLFVQVHLEDRNKVYLGQKRVHLELMNYKREKCGLEEVDTVSTSSVTTRYRCGKTVLYVTQKAVDIEVELPPSAKDSKLLTGETE